LHVTNFVADFFLLIFNVVSLTVEPIVTILDTLTYHGQTINMKRAPTPTPNWWDTKHSFYYVISIFLLFGWVLQYICQIDWQQSGISGVVVDGLCQGYALYWGSFWFVCWSRQ